MKRTVLYILCVLMIASSLSLYCFAGDEEYWPAQKQYQQAVSSGDESAILTAVKQIEAAYPNPRGEAQYSRVAFPLQKAAAIYERQSKYDDAVRYYSKFLKYISWLDQNTNNDYSYYTTTIPMLIEHLSVQPEVYVATTKTSVVPYYNAKFEPKLGTYFGTCGSFDSGKESAFLLYVQFGEENIYDFKKSIQDIGEDYILEIAWNLKKESLEGLKEVNGGIFNTYIEENISYLATLEGKVILRFGAEVNCWDDNTTSPTAMATQFKKAYIKIAKQVRTTAPNVALVFSPNEISNMNVKIEDFYPGDQYVDWVGMSSYQNLTSSATNTVSSTDAFYSRGNYENMMVKIKPIIDAFGDRKPIMISECGFAYDHSSGIQTQAHAVQKLKEFYTYVNCVYPQVKLVLYFDTSNATSAGYCYRLADNEAVLSAYNQTVGNNLAMQGTLGDKIDYSYVKADVFSEKASTLDLRVYASYPSHKKTTVTVKVDGKKKIASSDGIYTLQIDSSKWSKGIHTVSVIAKSANTVRTVIKCFEKKSSGNIVCVGSLRDIPASHWAFEYIDGCLREKVFKGVSFESFEPDSVMTRAMFVQVLANVSGVKLSAYKEGTFSDVRNGDWYSKAVMWASQNGIVNGVGKGRFAPDDTVTREQMCSMISRYAEFAGTELPKTNDTIIFADQSKISSWALKDVCKCQRAGLISGEKSEKTYYFNPHDGATRAQASKIFLIFWGL